MKMISNTYPKSKFFMLSFLIFLIVAFMLLSPNQVQAEDYLMYGDEGEEVEELQSRLSDLGFYEHEKTGFYGERTQRGVELFQDAANLTPDGVFGEETQMALRTAEGRLQQPDRLEIFDRGPEVIVLQYVLFNEGYLDEEPSGLFRSLTHDAVKDFQREHELEADGVVDNDTWAELNKYSMPATADHQDEIDVETDRAEDTADEAETREEIEEDETPELSSAFTRGDSDPRVEEAQERLRQLGYYPGQLDGVYGHQTKMAVLKYQKLNGLNADGVLGPETWRALFEEGSNGEDTYVVQSGDSLWEIARRFDTSVNSLKNVNDMNSSQMRTGERIRIPGGSQRITHDIDVITWDQVDSFFSRGRTAIITDVRTGLSFRVKRTMGTLHADVEPLTARDTQAMRRIYGGSWSWDRRPVVVHIGSRLIAASINGMPHGSQTIYDNNFNGHFCVHFRNSRLHKNNQQDGEHQHNVRVAGDQTWPVQ